MHHDVLALADGGEGQAQVLDPRVREDHLLVDAGLQVLLLDVGDDGRAVRREAQQLPPLLALLVGVVQVKRVVLVQSAADLGGGGEGGRREACPPPV